MARCRIKYTSVAIGKIGEIIASKVLFAGDVGNMLCFPRLKRAGNAFRSSYQNPIKSYTLKKPVFLNKSKFEQIQLRTMSITNPAFLSPAARTLPGTPTPS